MAIQTINLGSYANDGTGDDLRSAFTKVNSNFSALDAIVASSGTNLGAGVGVFAGKITSGDIGDSLSFKSLVAGSNVTLSNNSTTITISVPNVIAEVVNDTSPMLGGTLAVNNNPIENYDSNTSLFGDLILNSVKISGGDTTIDTSTVTLGNNLAKDNLTISAGNNLMLSAGTGSITFADTVFASNITGTFIGNLTGNIIGDSTGLHIGPVNGSVTGNLLGDTTGTHTGAVLGNVTGNVVGNVTGTVSSLSNHQLSDLNDVAINPPSIGQSLVWTGTDWRPSTIIGDNSNNADFGTFTNELPVAYEFGSLLNPTYITLNLGAFDVWVVNGPLKMASFTTSARDALTAENGDIIYNSSTNKFQGYENGAWVNLI